MVVPMVDVLIVDGFQLPIIPFIDLVGNIGSGELRQSGPIGAKIGVTWLVISTSSVVVVPHCPAAGWNV